MNNINDLSLSTLFTPLFHNTVNHTQKFFGVWHFSLIFIFGGFLGAIFASFLGNIAYRKSLKSVLKGFSHCEKCNKQLSAKQLFPIIGWVLNKGKCPYCSYKVPIIYPLFELMMFIVGGLVALGTYQIGFDFTIIAGVLVLGYLAIFDLLFYEIDEKVVNWVTLFGFVLFVVRLFSGFDFPYVANGIAIFIVWGCYLVLTKASKKTLMGMGDFRFFTMLLLIVPWQLFIAGFWAGGVIGGIVALVVVLLKPNSWKGTKIPYIPLFSMGIFLAWYMGWDNVVQEWIDVLILYRSL